MSCYPNFVFSIDGHNLTVIEADGDNVQPLVVDSLQVFAGMKYSRILPDTRLAHRPCTGQRYSAIVSASTQSLL